MQLIERYIQAVKFWLPRTQQDDIAAELHANILSQAEDKEAELGHPLQEEDEVAILKQLGPPPLVAASYRPDQGTVAFGRQWIGPLVYPFYRVAVKTTLAVLGLLQLLDAATRVITGRTTVMQAIIQGAWQLFDVAIMPLLLATAAFAAIDYALKEYRLAEKWDQRTLPMIQRQPVVPRANSIAGLIVQCVFVLWWLNLPNFSAVTIGVLRPAPIWQTLYLPTLFIAFVILAQHLATLVRPTWSWLPPAVGFLTSILSLVILYPILQAHSLASLTTMNSTELADFRLSKINTHLHFWVLVIWISIVIVAVVDAVKTARLLRNLVAAETPASAKPVVNGA